MSTGPKEQIAVVGAGFAGLSAACHLRGLGHDVVVLEAGDDVGGRAGSIWHEGARFDTGPTVITMPELLDEAFEAVDAQTDEFCQLIKLDPAYLARFDDGSTLRIGSTVAATAAEIEAKMGRQQANEFHEFVDWVGRLYDVTFPSFIGAEVDRPATLLSSLPDFARLIKLGGLSRWDGHVRRIFSDERLRRMFSFQALYAGVSPLDALGVFAVIAHMDTVAGVYSAVGGAHGVASGMANAARKAGVEIRCGQKVTSVRPAGNGRGVRIGTENGGEQDMLEAEAAVVTVDLPLAYDDLLDTKRPWAVRRGRPSPSCIVWHVATDRPVEHEIGHLNVYFGKSWDGALTELFDGRRPLADPSRFITAPAVSDRSSWDGVHQPLSVLEPVPDLTADLDWQTLTPALTERMLGWLGDQGFSVSSDPVAVVDPPAWRSQGAAFGTPFSLSHRMSQSGPFRPLPTNRKLPGVVFAGAGTHPGVGVPMVVLSGKLAANKVHRMVTGNSSNRLAKGIAR